jgi:hypothetical protein
MGNKSKTQRTVITNDEGVEVRRLKWRQQRDMATARQVRSRTSWMGIAEKTIAPRISLVSGPPRAHRQEHQRQYMRAVPRRAA